MQKISKRDKALCRDIQRSLGSIVENSFDEDFRQRCFSALNVDNTHALKAVIYKRLKSICEGKRSPHYKDKALGISASRPPLAEIQPANTVGKQPDPPYTTQVESAVGTLPKNSLEEEPGQAPMVILKPGHSSQKKSSKQKCLNENAQPASSQSKASQSFRESSQAVYLTDCNPPSQVMTDFTIHSQGRNNVGTLSQRNGDLKTFSQVKEDLCTTSQSKIDLSRTTSSHSVHSERNATFSNPLQVNSLQEKADFNTFSQGREGSSTTLQSKTDSSSHGVDFQSNDNLSILSQGGDLFGYPSQGREGSSTSLQSKIASSSHGVDFQNKDNLSIPSQGRDLFGFPSQERTNFSTGSKKRALTSQRPDFGIYSQGNPYVNSSQSKNDFSASSLALGLHSQQSANFCTPSQGRDIFGIPSQEKADFCTSSLANSLSSQKRSFRTSTQSENDFRTWFSRQSEHNADFSIPSQGRDLFGFPSQERTNCGTPSQADSASVQEWHYFSTQSQSKTYFSASFNSVDSQKNVNFGNPSQKRDLYGIPTHERARFSTPSQGRDLYGVPAHKRANFSNPSKGITFTPSRRRTDEHEWNYDSVGHSKRNREFISCSQGTSFDGSSKRKTHFGASSQGRTEYNTPVHGRNGTGIPSPERTFIGTTTQGFSYLDTPGQAEFGNFSQEETDLVGSSPEKTEFGSHEQQMYYFSSSSSQELNDSVSPVQATSDSDISSFGRWIDPSDPVRRALFETDDEGGENRPYQMF